MSHLISLLTVALAAAFAPPASQPASGPTSMLNQVIAANHLSGVMLAAEDGKIVFHEAFGVATPEGRPVEIGDRFEVASVTKPLTAMAILKLVDDGELELDQPVAEVLQGFPQKSITIRQLLTHVAGYPSHIKYVADYVGIDKVAPFEAFLTPMFDGTVAPERPGTNYVYTNLHYWLLCRVIEETTGQTYAEAMKTLIFEPLDMKSTTIGVPAEGTLAMGLVREGENLVVQEEATDNQFTVALVNQQGDVHLHTTCADLLKLAAVLDEPPFRQMLEAQKDTDGSEIVTGDWLGQQMGLGWRLADGGQIVYHTGDWGGYRAAFYHHRGTGRTLIYTLNQEPANWGFVSEPLDWLRGNR